MNKEYTYDIGKYTIGVDANGEDKIGLTVAIINENGEIHFLGNCYGDNARCIDLLIKENQQLKEKIQELKKKYKKSLELLIKYNLPCEIDNFTTKEENLEYCFKNCSVDERIYIKCWNRFIEQELEKE